ncbi:8-oxoguanine DNA glycosylase OGG fold protein [Epilithonimonas tenax]|uniref:8-oxoguanine DNA glycosylase OGG fold protein n=1 Tax=Epilithonimonas tenax TaxID=191577 RepID=UPI0004015313|nr:hypothetical protein [Epilithonimonas tenax]
MNIETFSDLIKFLPTEMSSFRIKKSNWNVASQMKIINDIFEENEFKKISRSEIRAERKNLNIFVIKTLMWGYPTKGRGNNIENLLDDENFSKLQTLLHKYYNIKTIPYNLLVSDLKYYKIKGLGISTLSKFLYFLDIKIDGYKCVILDDKLIDIINNSNFKEVQPLKGITREFALKQSKNKLNYVNFLETINNISLKLNVEPENVEMFLFFFGKSL